MTKCIVVLEGDQTGQELLNEALRVLDPAVTGYECAFIRFDLGLENRRKTKNQVVLDAAAAMKERGLGLKAATITPEGAGDVGSPNAILRDAVDGTVIVRTGRRIPGVSRRKDGGKSIWRAKVHGQPNLRRDVERRDGRRGQTLPQRTLRAATD